MIARHGQLGVLSASEMLKVLDGTQTAHLGCWKNGEGYVVPITFVVSPEGSLIYSHTREGKKIEMMRSNPNVCFQVEEFLKPSGWRSVVAWGKFEELSGEPAAEGMRLLVQKLGGRASSLEADFASMLEGAIIFGIKIEKMTGRYE